MLTNKAKIDFLNWLDKQDLAPYRVMFDDIPKFIQTAYIIQWLDEIGLIIEIDYERASKQYFGNLLNCLKSTITRQDISNNFNSRTSFEEEGIKQANLIYNENNRNK